MRAKNRVEFIRAITQQKPLFWYDICVDEGLGYQDKVNCLKDIFMYLDAKDIILQDTVACDKDSVYSIQSFIVEHDEVLEQLQEAGADKVVRSLVGMGAKFKDINLETIDKDIISGIFWNQLFKISINMLQKYADFKAGEKVVDFSTNVYTYILQQEDLSVVNYLESNIREFVEEVILKEEKDTKESFDTVRKCIQLLDYDENISVQIIQKMEVVMDDLKEWLDSVTDQKTDVRKIVDTFLAENKMVASIVNLDTYKRKYEFSSVLCSYVDENICALLSDDDIDDAHVKELLKKDIKETTVEITLKNYTFESFGENLNVYCNNVVQAMIKLKYFKYTRNRYNQIFSAFPNLLPLFVECYWEEFSEEVSSISFDLASLNEFIKSELSDDKKIVFLNKVDVSQMTKEMFDFVADTDLIVPKKYLMATWDQLRVEDRPAFMVKHFESFGIAEIENMFAQMPNEYHALKQEERRHEVSLKKNAINKALCEKLVDAEYLSSYDVKKENKNLFTGHIEKYVARVKAKR